MRAITHACAAPRLTVTSTLALMLTPGAALAADIYVDASAAAGGDGTAGNPFADLQDGLDAAMPGDTVHVLPGTYGPLQTVRDGTQSDRITVVAEPARMAIVQADGRALDASHEYHTFTGLVFDSAYGSGDGLRTDGANHLELRDVEVRRATGDCVDLRTISDVLIQGSTIHHCVGQPDGGGTIADAHGVTGDSVFDLTIRDTEIYMTTGDSVQMSPSREAWDDLVIEGCTLWTAPLDEDAGALSAGTPIGENAVDTKVGDGVLNGAGQNPKLTIVDVVAYGWRDYITNQGAILLKENVDAVVDRVTVYDSELGFRLRAPANVRVQNAVVHGVDWGFRLEDGIAGLEVFNITVGPTTMGVFDDAGGAPVDLTIQNGLFLADALPPEAGDPSNLATDEAVFVDASAHDYHLLEGSAPVDAGVTIAAVDQDRDGVARPVGAAHDVGAYEWTDAPPPGGTDTGGTGTGTPGGTDGSGSGGGTGTGGDPPGDDGSSGTHGSGAGSAGGDGNGGGCGCVAPAGRVTAPWLLVVLAARRRPRMLRNHR